MCDKCIFRLTFAQKPLSYTYIAVISRQHGWHVFPTETSPCVSMLFVSVSFYSKELREKRVLLIHIFIPWTVGKNDFWIQLLYKIKKSNFIMRVVLKIYNLMIENPPIISFVVMTHLSFKKKERTCRNLILVMAIHWYKLDNIYRFMVTWWVSLPYTCTWLLKR